MFRHSALIVLIVTIIAGAFTTHSSQDEESEILLDNVKFKRVNIVPTSESVYSLMSGVDITELGEMIMSSDEGIVAYGFSDEEKTLHQKFFVVGNLYADLLLKLDADYNKETVIERIKALQDGLDNVGAPNAIYIYLFNLQNMVAEDEYPGEVFKRFAFMLYPFIEEFAQSAPSGALVSLQAGHWLVDFGIAAAGGNEILVRQSETASFFADTYEELDVPKGVAVAFREIAAIASKPELDDGDFEHLTVLSEDIRGFLR